MHRKPVAITKMKVEKISELYTSGVKLSIFIINLYILISFLIVYFFDWFFLYGEASNQIEEK